MLNHSISESACWPLDSSVSRINQWINLPAPRQLSQPTSNQPVGWGVSLSFSHVSVLSVNQLYHSFSHPVSQSVHQPVKGSSNVNTVSQFLLATNLSGSLYLFIQSWLVSLCQYQSVNHISFIINQLETVGKYQQDSNSQKASSQVPQYRSAPMDWYADDVCYSTSHS